MFLSSIDPLSSLLISGMVITSDLTMGFSICPISHGYSISHETNLGLLAVGAKTPNGSKIIEERCSDPACPVPLVCVKYASDPYPEITPEALYSVTVDTFVCYKTVTV